MDDHFRKSRIICRTARQQLWERLQRDSNITGVAFGRRTVGKCAPEGPALVVYVSKKLSLDVIPPSLRLPRKVYVGNDALEVDVVETGPFYVQAFTARERPAPSGISIGHPDITAGTLGCLVTDNTDGSLCILSNNHVLANSNLAAIGDPSLQPGPSDGGNNPGDEIAQLKRFEPVTCSGTNRIDAAISEVTRETLVAAEFKNNLMPYPGPNHPAVGLLFAGGGGRTILNPIRDVMATLDISFLAGAEAIGEAEIDMPVEKVGRTTEYTTGRVMEIDATTLVGGYDCGSAAFDGQITTCTMSCGGDSGSVVCEGGEGECEEIDCGCGTSTAATRAFGLDVSLDRIVEKDFRKRHLSRTCVGKYAIDVYFANENAIVERVNKASREDDQGQNAEYAKYLHGKYADVLRQALLQPDRADVRLSAEHLDELRDVLGRAKPYMAKEEVQAAEELLEIAREAAGKNTREILEMLDSQKLLERVKKLVRGVPSLRDPSEDC